MDIEQCTVAVLFSLLNFQNNFFFLLAYLTHSPGIWSEPESTQASHLCAALLSICSFAKLKIWFVVLSRSKRNWFNQMLHIKICVRLRQVEFLLCVTDDKVRVSVFQIENSIHQASLCPVSLIRFHQGYTQ